jgi:hypothetical protein
MRGYERIARLAGLQVQEKVLASMDQDAASKDQDAASAIATRVRDWLTSEESGKWLMIFDNVNSESALSALNGRFLNAGMRGSVLITSQDAEGAAANWPGTGIEVSGMSLSEGAELLLKMIGEDHYQAEMTKEIATAEAEELVGAMECLPLAISQAAPYIRAYYNGNIHRYRLDFLKEMESFLSENTSLTSRYHTGLDVTGVSDVSTNRTFFVTWDMCFRQLETINPASTVLILMFSLFDPQHLSLKLFEICKHEELIWDASGSFHPVPSSERALLPQLVSLVQSPVALQKALGDLCRYSLVRQKRGSTDLSMHSLVRLWAFSRLRGDRSRWDRYVKCFIRMIAGNLARQDLLPPTSDSIYSSQSTWPGGLDGAQAWPLRQYSELIQNGIKCIEHAAQLTLMDGSTAQLAMSLLSFLECPSTILSSTRQLLAHSLLERINASSIATSVYLKPIYLTWRIQRYTYCGCHVRSTKEELSNPSDPDITLTEPDGIPLARRDPYEDFLIAEVRNALTRSEGIPSDRVKALEKYRARKYAATLAIKHCESCERAIEDIKQFILSWPLTQGVAATPFVNNLRANLFRQLLRSEISSVIYLDERTVSAVVGFEKESFQNWKFQVSDTARPLSVRYVLASSSFHDRSKDSYDLYTWEVITESMKSICGPDSEEYLRSLWYLTDHLRQMSRFGEAQLILESLIPSIVKEPSTQISLERLVDQLLRAYLAQDKRSDAAQTLYNVHKAYKCHGLRLESVENHHMLRLELLRRQEWSDLFHCYESEASRLASAVQELETLIDRWQPSTDSDDADSRKQLVQSCARARARELKIPYCNALYSAAYVACEIGAWAKAAANLDIIVKVVAFLYPI